MANRAMRGSIHLYPRSRPFASPPCVRRAPTPFTDGILPAQNCPYVAGDIIRNAILVRRQPEWLPNGLVETLNVLLDPRFCRPLTTLEHRQWTLGSARAADHGKRPLCLRRNGRHKFRLGRQTSSPALPDDQPNPLGGWSLGPFRQAIRGCGQSRFCFARVSVLDAGFRFR
jgi:hypothetical protein